MEEHWIYQPDGSIVVNTCAASAILGAYCNVLDDWFFRRDIPEYVSLNKEDKSSCSWKHLTIDEVPSHILGMRLLYA